MQERTLYVVQYEAKPALSGEDSTASGAYVNVWVDAPSEAEAVRIAAAEIEAEGWSLENSPEVTSVQRNDYDNDDAGLEYFEQALVDGVVLVFNTWRPPH